MSTEIEKTEVKKETEAPKKEESTSDYHTLRFRSTGLGKTMLQGEPAEVKIVDDMF